MLIGITGLQGAGKDTIADIIIKQQNGKNYEFEKKSLAEPIKKISKELFLLSDEQLYSDNKNIIDNRWGITPRKIFQTIGTDIFRNHLNDFFPNLYNFINNESFWINHFKEWYKNNDNKYIIIPDIRFEDEAKMVKNLNGIIIKVIRDSCINDEHESEKNIINIKEDFLIYNNFNINILKEKIIDILIEISKNNSLNIYI